MWKKLTIACWAMTTAVSAQALSLVSVQNETGHTLAEVKYVQEGGVWAVAGYAQNLGDGEKVPFMLPGAGNYRVYIAYLGDGRMHYAKGSANYVADNTEALLVLQEVVSTESGNVREISAEEFERLARP